MRIVDSSGSVKYNIGAAGGDLTGTFPNPTLSFGTLRKISSATAATSATLDFTNLTGYSSFKFVLQNIVPVSNAVDFYVRYSTNNGSTWASSSTNYSYDWVFALGATASPTPGGYSDGNGGTTQFLTVTSISSLANAGVSGEYTFVPAGSSGFSRIHWLQSCWQSSSILASTMGTGICNLANTVNGIRFMFSSGSISTGTIVCYGLSS